MTKQGKYNFLSLIGLPAAAVLGAWIAKLNGVWDAYLNTYLFVFGLNFVAVMLIPVILCGLLLLWSGGTVSRWLAVAPAILTAAIGGMWYLVRAVFPDPVAPGAEYIGAAQFLLPFALLLVFIVLVLRVFGIVSRTA